mmetsp:Transcript_69999/g.195824  ORF Transcript_69999/g.195824 Transcript_69999/m.195824 type:complete len:338 (+) Transcript_69999:272-1285(+)
MVESVLDDVGALEEPVLQRLQARVPRALRVLARELAACVGAAVGALVAEERREVVDLEFVDLHVGLAADLRLLLLYPPLACRVEYRPVHHHVGLLPPANLEEFVHLELRPPDLLQAVPLRTQHRREALAHLVGIGCAERGALIVLRRHVPVLVMRGGLARDPRLGVVVERADAPLLQVERPFGDVLVRRLVRVPREFEGHFLCHQISRGGLAAGQRVLRLGRAARVLPHRDRTVDKVVGAAFEELGDLSADVLLALDEAVLPRAHVEVDLTPAARPLNRLLEAARPPRQKALHCFTLERETDPLGQLVVPVGERLAALLDHGLRAVFVQGQARDRAL